MPFTRCYECDELVPIQEIGLCVNNRGLQKVGAQPVITEQLFSISEVTERLERLLGPGYTVEVMWDGSEKGGKYWYELTAWKDGKRADWVMTCEDLGLPDQAVVARFLQPMKNAVWAGAQ